jgi:nucleoside-diphosphate-sugar epimerase
LTRAGDVVNLSSGRLTSVRRFVEVAAGELGIEPNLLCFGVLPASEWDMQITAVSTESVQRLLAWLPPTSIEQGIRNTAAAACAPVLCR